MSPSRPRISFDLYILLLALLAGLPGSAVALILLWTGDFAARSQWLLTLGIGGFWVGFAVTLRERVIRSLQTLSNLLSALHQGEFSMRARTDGAHDSLSLAMLEANMLAETLRQQRLDALEAAGLLRKVMEEIDVAVFAFDDKHRLRLANRGAEQLLGRPADVLEGAAAYELGIADLIGGESPRIVERAFSRRAGRWEVRTTAFRLDGRPHNLVVMTDVSRVLREEERQAWKRLIRVLGHEINNSLAPIRSIAESLGNLVQSNGDATEGAEDLRQGLSIISSRAEALSRFMASYARLARLPPPELQRLAVASWVRRVVGLETRLKVSVHSGPEVTVMADGDQLDQVLINLVDNAVDAALETGGSVEVEWETRKGKLEVAVVDEGPGVPDTSNLFVPFYTTKSKGSGIGLALSLQIAEAHGGTISLHNRKDGHGCRATLKIPLGLEEQSSSRASD
jgi:nitrogen fixation/metabolism regulation signal transduction histidine kinase